MKTNKNENGVKKRVHKGGSIFANDHRRYAPKDAYLTDIDAIGAVGVGLTEDTLYARYSCPTDHTVTPEDTLPIQALYDIKTSTSFIDNLPLSYNVYKTLCLALRASGQSTRFYYVVELPDCFDEKYRLYEVDLDTNRVLPPMDLLDAPWS